MVMKKYRYHWRIVFVLFFIWGIINLFRMSINFLFPFMMESFLLDESTLSLFTAWISVFWTLGVFASGKLTDYFREYLIFLFGLIVLAIGALILYFSSGMIELFLSLGFFGFGGGIQGPTCIVMITNYGNPDNLGTSLGLIQSSSGLLGLTIGATAITAAGELLGWENVYFSLAMFAVFIAILIWFAFHKLPVQSNCLKSMTNTNEKRSFRSVWGYRNIKVSIVICIAIFSWSMLVNAYSIIYFANNNILDLFTASSALGAMGIGGFVGTIVITSISDYIGRKKVTSICILASTIAFYFVVFSQLPYYGIIISMFVVGLSTQGLLALISAVIQSI